MSPTDETAVGSGDGRDFLCVEPFLAGMVEAQALKTALALGLVDRLAGVEAIDQADLGAAGRATRPGCGCCSPGSPPAGSSSRATAGSGSPGRSAGRWPTAT